MFSWYHWILVVVPVFGVCALAVYSRRYVRSVSDFLVAGRCAGRYVLLSGGMMGNLAVTTLIASTEVAYNNGYAFQFWNAILTPLAIMLSLYGWITYRFRETRAMSAGQFFEMRYSRGLRRLAAVLRGGADMLGNCIGPAVAVRFFIYLLGIPHRMTVFGTQVRTFPFLLAACLTLALLMILCGGRISLLVTDAVQGLFAYPLFVTLIIFVLCNFSWWDEIAPVLSDRVPGESFLNPYDIQELRDFNLFGLMVQFYRKIMGGEWVGNGYGTVARSAHEGKMANLLNSFGAGMAWLMPFFLVVGIIVTMNHRDHAAEAHRIRQELSTRVAEEIAPNPEVAETISSAAAAVPEQIHIIGVDPPLSRERNLDHDPPKYGNLDTPTLDAVRGALSASMEDQAAANKLYQGYRTTYMQQMLPVAVRNIFPKWLVALLLMLCILLVLSTDDTRVFDIAMTWTQDFILPFFKTAPSPRLHLAIFKAVVVAVGVCFWLGSCLFAQLDYINMFITIGCSMWFTGAGAIVTLGLYWRRGTTAGAYASLLSAASVSLCGILVQRNWADKVLPWLTAHGLESGVRHFLEAVSRPFEPWIRWTVTDAEWTVKFPVNSIELSFTAMLIAVTLYVIVSLLTCRKPFNLEKMLHRGQWADAPAGNNGALRANDGGALRQMTTAPNGANDGGAAPQMTNSSLPPQAASHCGEAASHCAAKPRQSFAKRLLNHLVGITPEYKREDRILAWAVFSHSIVYGFFGSFLLVALLAKTFHWSIRAWSIKYFVTGVTVPLLLGVITTIWFTWGTTRDIRRLFRDLETRVRDDRDNGMVSHD